MYYIYITVSLVSVFIPFGRRLSIDSYLLNRKNPGKIPTTTSAFNYFIIVFTGIGLTYADSVFHKFASHLWLNGLGVWLPSSIPQIVIRDFTPLLNMKWLMLFLGYFTLAFEAAFIFIFWIKPIRFWLFIIGLGLHISITLVYPIPYFGLGMSALYLLLLPVKYWKCLFRKWTHTKQSIVIANTIDKRKVNMAFTGTLLLIFMQSIFIYYSPVMGSLKKRIPLAFVIPNMVLDPISTDLRTGFNKFFGFHQHGVFIDGHFNNYDHNISIMYHSDPPILLPLHQESGMVGSYQSGPLWAKWGFRTNSPRVDSTRLINGARDFSLLWMHENNLPFDKQSFNLVFKRNACPTKWEKDFLKNQLKQPWVKFGSFHWKNEQLYIDSINFKMLYGARNPFCIK